jgi:hypothetical protein
MHRARRRFQLVLLVLVLGAAGASRAGPADVVAATADCSASTCTFTATVRHADQGWSHYADAWEVVAPDGRILGTRVLQHPHVEEQPVTRDLRDVAVPADVGSVRIRAHDSVHGYGGREVEVPLRR